MAREPQLGEVNALLGRGDDDPCPSGLLPVCSARMRGWRWMTALRTSWEALSMTETARTALTSTAPRATSHMAGRSAARVGKPGKIHAGKSGPCLLCGWRGAARCNTS